MFKVKRSALIATLLTSILVSAQGAASGNASEHPGYLHALTDLRLARAVLERREGWGRASTDQARAIYEINAAITELSQGAAEESKKLSRMPPIDQHWEPEDRVHRALEALGQARQAITGEEDSPMAFGWRDRTFRHIEMAQQATTSVLETAQKYQRQ